MELAIELELVEKSGSWFSYNGARIAQGRDNARKYFESNPELMSELENKIKDKIANGDVVSAAEEELDTSDFDIDALNLD